MTTNGGLKTLNNDTKSDINNNNNTLNSSHVDFSPDVGVEVDFTPRDSQRSFSYTTYNFKCYF